MMNYDFIDQHYHFRAVGENRWRFEPEQHWRTDSPAHRYYLTFVATERRFILTRQKIQPFETVNDEEQLSVFRSFLTAEQVAACMRGAIAAPPEDDPIPF